MIKSRLLRYAGTIAVVVLLVIPLVPIGPIGPSTLAAAPRLSLSKRQAEPGTIITASGRRFPARAAGELLWSVDGTVLATIQTSATGAFSVRFAVPITPGAVYDVTASVDGVAASASLEVVAAPNPAPTETSVPTDMPQPTDVPPPTATTAPTVAPPPTDTPSPTATTQPTPTGAATDSGSFSAASALLTLSFASDADAWVEEANPTANHGSDLTLSVDASPHEESFLRFVVSGVTGAVTSAVIRVYLTSQSVSGPEVYGVGSDWTESGLTWNTRPPRTTAKLDNFAGATGDNVWLEFKVQALVTANGTYSFVFAPTSGDGLAFASREGANPPQLVLTVDTSGAAAPTPTPLPAATLGPGPTPTVLPTATQTPAAQATPVPMPAAPTGAIAFVPLADALVNQSYPSTNYGTISTLVADGSPVEEAYLRFQVSGTGGSTGRAILRLYVSNGTTIPIQVYLAADTWTETGLTWENRPARSLVAFGELPLLPVNTWVDFDVTSLIGGDGTVSFVFVDAHSDGAVFSSRETINPPQLYVVPGNLPGTSPVATATPTSTPKATATATATPGTTSTPTGSTATPTATPAGTPILGGSVTAAGETAPVPHGGDAADDPAIWIHPTDPSLSTIIGTDKLGGLAVYDLSGRQLSYDADSAPNNVDLRYNFPLGGRRVDLVVTSDTANGSIRIYAVDPTSRGLAYVAARTISTGIGVAGICMYHSPVSGKYYVFVGDNSGTNQQWELFDNGAGLVDARKVRTISLSSVTEGLVADDGTGALYVAQEDLALWRYGAEPDTGDARTQVDVVGNGHLTADIEGLTIYYGGGGYLIASSQGSDQYAVYQRGDGNAYLGNFAVAAGSIDGVTHTDGIDVTNVALGGSYGSGLFVAQDDKNDGSNQNFKLVPWGQIAAAIGSGLAIDTGYDPRSVGSADPAPTIPTPTPTPSPASATPTATPTRTPTPSPTATATPGSSGSKTYYVDSASGNDANAGTSASAPWKTLTKANTASLAPGDRLLFKRGGSWAGKLTVSRSGTGANPIVIGSYGTGNPPIIQGSTGCVALSGSYLTLQEFAIKACSWAGVDLTGSGNLIQRCIISNNVAGIYVHSGATDNRILSNQIVDNNRMSVLTPGGHDDSGAFGVLLRGDNTEVAYNTISGSDAFSYDYGRDGSAVEVYGGQGNHIHHNLAIDNDAFTELGNARSADNSFSYNVVRSSLDTSTFLVTRGAKSSYGPVLRTRTFNNTVVLTGGSSQGVVCSSGCGPNILSMRNNIVQAVLKVGYADAAFDEDFDVFFGGKVQFTLGSHSVVADPRFASAATGDFHLTSGSPAIDLGVTVGYSRDFDGTAVPLDGNGDGVALPDAGAYEYRG